MKIANDLDIMYCEKMKDFLGKNLMMFLWKKMKMNNFSLWLKIMI